jgi:hypothetical protein
MKTLKDSRNSGHELGDETLKVVLRQRYGDGTIYLCTPAQRLVLNQAQWCGYVSMEGQITPFGVSFLLSSDR